MATLLYKWLFVSLLPVTSFLVSDQPVVVATREQGLFHPFYVSVTEINHNSKDKTLEISCRIFADDMEDVLKQNYRTPVDLTNTGQQAQNDKLINDYITRHLAITADGKATKMNYIGYEKDSESVYCYFEVTDVTTVKKIDLNISILQDLTPDQINIMHVTVNGTRKSYKLDYPKKLASFSF